MNQAEIKAAVIEIIESKPRNTLFEISTSDIIKQLSSKGYEEFAFDDDEIYVKINAVFNRHKLNEILFDYLYSKKLAIIAESPSFCDKKWPGDYNQRITIYFKPISKDHP